MTMPARITRYAVFCVVLLLLSGCGSLLNDRIAAVAGLSELERGKLMYVEAANEWLLISEEIYSRRSAAAVSDADWAKFDAIQNAVRLSSLEVIRLRRIWETTNSKPPGWDAAMANLLLNVEAGNAMIGGKR